MARAFPIVYVPDVQRSAAFYAGRLGFHEIFRMAYVSDPDGNPIALAAPPPG